MNELRDRIVELDRRLRKLSRELGWSMIGESSGAEGCRSRSGREFGIMQLRLARLNELSLVYERELEIARQTHRLSRTVQQAELEIAELRTHNGSPSSSLKRLRQVAVRRLRAHDRRAEP